MLRHDYLRRQLQALRARVRMLAGREAHVRRGVAGALRRGRARPPGVVLRGDAERIERALPGHGPLVDRYDAFRQAFVVPPDRLAARLRPRDRRVPQPDAAARRSCRRPRASPSSTSPNKPWSGYNWYQGNYRSLIQVNTDLPIYIDRAIDLACHEGYPGHHVYNALLEQHLVRDRGWIEFSVYPLFSPQSLIAEGTANYGIEVAFPATSGSRSSATCCFPLAGLDASQAALRAGARARRSAGVRRERSGAKVSERGDRSRRRRGLAGALRADVDAARPSSARASSTPIAAT